MHSEYILAPHIMLHSINVHDCSRTLEAALERRTVEWQAALAERSIAHAALEDRQQAGTASAAERDAAAQACIEALTQQLEQSNDQLLQVSLAVLSWPM